jgi:hypothetical protein
VRKLIGTALGYAALLLGVAIPLLMLAGVSGMIFGCCVFHGPHAKGDLATTFAIVSIIIGIPICVWTVFCLVSLPIFAYFGVRVVPKRPTRPNKTVALARSMKEIALRYAVLMDKLIDQEKV